MAQLLQPRGIEEADAGFLELRGHGVDFAAPVPALLAGQDVAREAEVVPDEVSEKGLFIAQGCFCATQMIRLKMLSNNFKAACRCRFRSSHGGRRWQCLQQKRSGRMEPMKLLHRLHSHASL